MKRHLLIAAAIAAVAAPAVPASAQSVSFAISSVSSAQSWERQNRYDRYERDNRYDRRGDRGNRAISNSEASRIASRYVSRVTDVNFERNVFFVSGQQRDGSSTLVTLDRGGDVISVVTPRDPRGRRVHYDHGIGYGSRR